MVVYIADPANPGWLRREDADAALESSWWQIPDGYVADPANPGWYYREGSDVSQQANWVHDPSVPEPEELLPISVDAVIRATGCNPQNTAENWPPLFRALNAVGAGSRASCAGAVATVAIETASTFAPIRELYNDPPGAYAYFERMYGAGNHPSAVAMGNTQPGDGAKYFGRGYIQLTWKNTYKAYGERLGIDLVGNPDLALDPGYAAKLFALYWSDRGIPAMCERGDWVGARRAVQGGTAGLDRLTQIVKRLGY